MKDEGFVRGNVPMTKSEVRAVSLSKLELWDIRTESEQGCPDGFGLEQRVVYDVGAGTGSVAVEAARQIGSRGKVYAIERSREALSLIEQNRDRFGVNNLFIVEGEAPEALEGLTPPTHVFVGGSGGRMEQILRAVLEKNPRARVVINAAAFETLTEVLAVLGKLEIEPEIVSVQVSRAVKRGSYHMLEGQNPVFVISFGGIG